MVCTARRGGKKRPQSARQSTARIQIDPRIGLSPGVREILRDTSIRLRCRHGIDPAGDRIAVDPPVGGPVKIGALMTAVLRRYGISGGNQ
jgi:hypothetical protein